MAVPPQDESGDTAEDASEPAPAEDEGAGEDEVDEASEESFPASDSPASWSGPPT